MSAFTGFKEFASRVAEARRRRTTRRIIESLPAHLRKDIGWPYSHDAETGLAREGRAASRPALFFWAYELLTPSFSLRFSCNAA